MIPKEEKFAGILGRWIGRRSICETAETEGFALSVAGYKKWPCRIESFTLRRRKDEEEEITGPVDGRRNGSVHDRMWRQRQFRIRFRCSSFRFRRRRRRQGITIVVKSLADQYWVLLKAGAEAKAKELGVKVEVIGPNAESDVQQQADMIQNADRYRALTAWQLLRPLRTPCCRYCRRQTAAGIPVIAVDTDLPNYENKKSFIGTGNEAAGKQGGEYAAELVGEGKKAIILRGRQGDTTHDQREAGFKKGLEAGGVEVLEVRGCDSEAEKAMNAMMDLMNRYDQIDIVCTTADSMAQGAQRAIENAGEDIPVIGFDGTIPVAELVAQGSVIKGTVAQDPYTMGELCC